MTFLKLMEPLHGFDYPFIPPTKVMQYHPPVAQNFPSVYVSISNTWIELRGSDRWNLNPLSNFERLGGSVNQSWTVSATLIIVNLHFDFWLAYCTSVLCFTLFTLHVLSGLKLICGVCGNNRVYVLGAMSRAWTLWSTAIKLDAGILD